METTTISGCLIKAGTFIGREPGTPEGHETRAEIESAHAIFLPSLDDCIKFEDLPEGEDERLTEDVLIITHLEEIGLLVGDQQYWFVEHLALGFWDVVEDAASAIHEIALGYITKWLDEVEGEKPTVLYFNFIGLWHVNRTQRYFDPYPEIDSIDFMGEGVVM